MLTKTKLLLTFALLILSIFTVINIYTSTNGKIKDNKLVWRLNSIYNSIKLSGNILKSLEVEKISSKDTNKYLFANGQYLLFISSLDGCNTCLWQELEGIKTIPRDTRIRMKTIYLYFGNNKINALQIKKFVPHEDSLFISSDPRLNALNYSQKFPYILYIKDGTIIDSHFPIPGDTLFSNLFYKRILNKQF